jgi:ribulose bisphosphate carboxylase small subunit
MLVMREERRSEVRMLCADMVDVFWKDGAGKKHQAVGLLEDICRSGACLQLETPVPLGVDILWKSPKREFTARVQYCVYREIGYFIGVEFDSASRWSKKAYTPQHLLDLKHFLEDSRTK